jgi:hypothetical protein
MNDFLGFMFFSLVEGFAVFSLMFYIFRIDIMRHLRPSIFMLLAINLQSFFTWRELSLSSIGPVINLLMTILFLYYFIRIPIIWSMVMTVTGYICFGVLQNIIIFMSDGYLTVSQVQTYIWKGYLLQVLSGFIGTAIGWTLYKFGIGFSFEFEKLRYKRERFLVILINIIFLVALGVMMYFKSIYTNLLVLVFSLVVFLLYTIRKEADER